MAEELKACPFCGRIPKTSHRPESEASGGGHVAFVVCYCGGYASTAHQMGHAETVQAAIAEVVEKWNTRAQAASQGGEAVAMRQRFSQIEDEIMDGKHTAASVFTQMRTAALYTHPADQVADPLKQIAWERRAGVMGCKRFMTQKVYDAQSPQMKGNYQPFYCAHCKADQVAEPDAELVELLRDARADLAAYIDGAYPQCMLEYPHNQRKHATDMEIVQRIDAKLASLK
jgi:hypothetical protein